MARVTRILILWLALMWASTVAPASAEWFGDLYLGGALTGNQDIDSDVAVLGVLSDESMISTPRPRRVDVGRLRIFWPARHSSVWGMIAQALYEARLASVATNDAHLVVANKILGYSILLIQGAGPWLIPSATRRSC